MCRNGDRLQQQVKYREVNGWAAVEDHLSGAVVICMLKPGERTIWSKTVDFDIFDTRYWYTLVGDDWLRYESILPHITFGVRSTTHHNYVNPNS